MAPGFEVAPAVLVANPAAEVLVRRGVEIARQAKHPLRVADVGTGSGNIAIAVAHYAPQVEVWAGDISRDALEVASRNVAKHGLTERVHLVCGDLLAPLPGSFDLVCANLPYIATDLDLPAEVKAQPASALFAEQGGAALVLRLIAAAPGRLNPGGRLLPDVDPNILAGVTAAANRTFSNVNVHRDLGGRDRGIEAWS